LQTEWFVARTHFQQEQQASLELQRQGFQTYMPQARVERKRKDGVITSKLRPLFTTYIFIGCDFETQRWQPVASTRGINQIIGWQYGSAKPPIVRPQDMMDLRHHVAEHGGVVPMGLTRPKYLEPGTLVQILFGPFRDQSVRVKADKGSRVEVLLQCLGVERPVKLSRECLAVAV